jgi:hypothetical protein
MNLREHLIARGLLTPRDPVASPPEPARIAAPTLVLDSWGIRAAAHRLLHPDPPPRWVSYSNEDDS